MQYRFRLGKYTGTTNLVTDGVFAQPCGVNWTCGASWNIAAGTASHAPGNTDFIEQSGVFTEGEEYEINFDVGNGALPFAGFVQAFLSGFSVGSNPDNDYRVTSTGSYSIYGRSLRSDSYIRFLADDHSSIDNIEVYQKIWNEPLTNHPANWEQTKIALKQSSLFEDLKVEMIEDLVFFGDAYDYLIGRYNTLRAQSPKGFCEKIPIKDERYVNGAWEKHFEGIIYLSQVKFDLKRKTATTTVFDVAASQVISTQRAVEIALKADTYYYDLTAAGLGFMFNFVYVYGSAGGGTYYLRKMYDFFRVIRHIVHETTDLNVTISSDLLTTTPYDGGVNRFENLALAPIRNLATSAPNNDMLMSIDKALESFNAIRNIGLVSQFVTVPTLKIESKQNLSSTNLGFTLDMNEATFEFYNEENFMNINIGYSIPTREDANSLLTYPTIPVTYDLFVNYDYRNKVKCSDQSKALISDIASCWSQMSEQLANTTAYVVPFDDRTPFYNTIFWTGVRWESWVDLSPTWVGGGGANMANFDLSFDLMMERHVFTLPSDYLEDTYDRQTSKANDPIIRVWDFEGEISLANLQAIEANPNGYFTVTSQYLDTTQLAYILDMEYNNLNDSAGTAFVKMKIITT